MYIPVSFVCWGCFLWSSIDLKSVTFVKTEAKNATMCNLESKWQSCTFIFCFHLKIKRLVFTWSVCKNQANVRLQAETDLIPNTHTLRGSAQRTTAMNDLRQLDKEMVTSGPKRLIRASVVRNVYRYLLLGVWRAMDSVLESVTLVGFRVLLLLLIEG